MCIPGQDFELIETLLLADGTYALLDEHLKRMGSSAKHFAMTFDMARTREVLQLAARSWPRGRARIRLLLDRNGRLTWTGSVLEADDHNPVDLLLWPERTQAENLYLRH